MSLAEDYPQESALWGERRGWYREAGIGKDVLRPSRPLAEDPEPAAIPALSLLQPWASLVILGAKEYETRSWPCPVRMIDRVIAIHSSARLPREMRECFSVQPFRAVLMGAAYPDYRSLPTGVVLGTVRILDCASTDDLAPSLSAQELAFGDYSANRWAWRLEVVERFAAPVPAKGRLGFWEFYL